MIESLTADNHAEESNNSEVTTTDYYEQYYAYVAQYGEEAARQAYGEWAPQESTEAPSTSVNDGKDPYYDFWLYAAHYGEDTARQYYGEYSPPVGSVPPAEFQQQEYYVESQVDNTEPQAVEYSSADIYYGDSQVYDTTQYGTAVDTENTPYDQYYQSHDPVEYSEHSDYSQTEKPPSPEEDYVQVEYSEMSQE